uniref:Transposase n=1 Tax=Raoultella ornithinolytica TaxID=54291 RepID=A0A0M3STE7_RAOOR|nr:transposase [Raoultella ornithinolytica]
MGVSRAQLSLRVHRFATGQDGRTLRRDEEADAEVLSRILGIISDMPSYGYRRVWGIMRRQLRDEGLPPVNAKRVYRVMSEHNLLLLHDKPQRPQREHNGKIAVAESNQRWCSDGFEFGCDDGGKLRVTFALDCCDRETIDWAASTGGYDSITVQDVMLGAVEKRFGATLPDKPVQWLTDNGSAYTAHDTRKFAADLNLEACTTAVSSPQSNGMAERKELLRLLGKKTMENELLKEAVEYGQQKVDSAQAFVARGWRISLVVAPSWCHVRNCMPWSVGRRTGRIVEAYRYRRSANVWLSWDVALLRRQSETDYMTVINAKRVYRIMRQNALLLYAF